MSQDEDAGLPPDRGVAGASAGGEGDRRKAKRVHEILMHHPFADKADVAARQGPAHERAFKRGASGEEWVARRLEKHLRPGAQMLHDRAMPTTRGNIDHIVAAPSGVWVVDAKRTSRTVAIHKSTSERWRLLVGGYDETRYVDALRRQVEAVEDAIAELAIEVSVHGALCFVETSLPPGRHVFEGLHIADPKALATRINVSAPQVDLAQVTVLAAELAQRLPPR